ncbi:MAG TPA: DUF4091 domain-containing protein [Armatimonadetes bacterium]|nr:DUF4091 domain-containing protein [Armatimonadota bacterium]
MGWPGFCLILLLVAAQAVAAPQRGENLLANPGFEQADETGAASWNPAGKGHTLAPGSGRKGGLAIACASSQADEYHGAMQEVHFDPPLQHPFEVSGWSKAEEAEGVDYCLYMDVFYADGTHLWGVRGDFSRGTHDWERVAYTFDVKKPVAKVQFFILFRKCTGKAWFDDVSLSLVPFRVESERLVVGLGGANNLEFRGLLSFPGGWTATILQGDQAVYAVSDEGERVALQWPGTDATGRALPGGAYTLRLDAKETATGEALRREWPVRTPRGAGAPYLAWVERSMQRVLRDALPPSRKRALRASVALAGNEYESFQVCLRALPGRDLESCTVTFSDLRDRRGNALSKEHFEWHQVGFVNISELYPHPEMKDALPGWWPDPLLPVSHFDVPGGTTQSVWFTLYAPPGTPAGTYRGEFTVTPENAPAVRIPVEARVYGFTLPTQPRLKTAFALMDGFLETVYGPLTPELRRQYGDYVLRHRLNPDDISRTDPPALEDLAHYATRGLNAFNVQNLVEPRGKRAWVCWSPISVYTPQFKESLIQRLDPYVADLKRRGLASKAYVYSFDERGEEFWPILREYFGLVKERWGIPTLTTAYIAQDPAVMKDLNIDWNCPLTARYDLEAAERCRAAGLQVWAYVCCSPRYPYANWLADDPLVEARVIWWQAYHQKMDGMLYWGLNIWGRASNKAPIDPEKDGPLLSFGITLEASWADRLHGDGLLLYPGKDGPIGSIRLANIRDGLEDYDYLSLLAEREGSIENARKACLPVTSGLAQFTRDPEVVLAERDRIARRIERAAAKR